MLIEFESANSYYPIRFMNTFSLMRIRLKFSRIRFALKLSCGQNRRMGHGFRFLLPLFFKIIRVFCVHIFSTDTAVYCGHRIHVLFMIYAVYWYCQMKKNELLWKFWKRNDYDNFEKRGRRKQNPCPMRLWWTHAIAKANYPSSCFDGILLELEKDYLHYYHV